MRILVTGGLGTVGAGIVADLRKRAMTHMRVYIQGIQDLHDLGYNWTPSSLILSNATTYLAEHPREK